MQAKVKLEKKQAEFNQIKKTFEKFDADKSGYLDAAEVLLG